MGPRYCLSVSLLMALLTAACSHTAAVPSAASGAGTPVPPSCTEIALDWVWSTGTSDGVIDVNSQKIFIVSFDSARWQGWLGWPTTADRIRIGPSWKVGTPALSYEFGDFNQDGVQDVLFAFSTEQLIADGNFPPHTNRIHLWARDESGTRQFCGVHEVRRNSD